MSKRKSDNSKILVYIFGFHEEIRKQVAKSNASYKRHKEEQNIKINFVPHCFENQIKIKELAK